MKPGIFFSTTLSSHIVPVIFAIGVLFIAERKISGEQTANKSPMAHTSTSPMNINNRAMRTNTVASFTVNDNVQTKSNDDHFQSSKYVQRTSVLSDTYPGNATTGNATTTANAATGNTTPGNATPANAVCSTTMSIAPSMFAIGAAGVQQVVAISRVSGLLMKIIR
ncbi:MAG: hypothetical protein EON99_00640 [Chitinophagaceae bacterium]|nr:MAG: hypothetical protein EON99_00640 [Chitinophagaceae bacterium]